MNNKTIDEKAKEAKNLSIDKAHEAFSGGSSLNYKSAILEGYADIENNVYEATEPARGIFSGGQRLLDLQKQSILHGSVKPDFNIPLTKEDYTESFGSASKAYKSFKTINDDIYKQEQYELDKQAKLAQNDLSLLDLLSKQEEFNNKVKQATQKAFTLTP